ncbi:MAG: hypothetical protein ACE14S_06705 [Candidatus Bathyarchaeia archaeon]
MIKKILFVLALIVGIGVISLSFYYYLGITNIVEWVALYVSGLTATYAILAEKNPNRVEKQQIYGQLKGILNNIVRTLENRNYHSLSFGLWDNIQQDHRYHYFDDKFAQRCDAFMERMSAYSSAIDKLDNSLLPKIIRNVAKEIFLCEPDPEKTSMTFLSLNLYDTKGQLLNSYSPDLVICLKTKQSMSDLEKKAITTISVKETQTRRIGLKICYTKAYEPLNLYRQRLEMQNDYSQSKFETISVKMITLFWEKCLNMVEKVPEEQFIRKENDELLKEAYDLRTEIIRRIKSTMKS